MNSGRSGRFFDERRFGDRSQLSYHCSQDESKQDKDGTSTS